ncbi:hypothetical protein ES708_00717 [subsurface metagenome]
MLIKFEEWDSHFYLEFEPETTEDVGLLLRFQTNILTDFSGDPITECFFIKKPAPGTIKNYVDR